MNLGPRADLVEALLADHLASVYGRCACGGPRGPKIVRHGTFEDGELRTVLRCDWCGRRGGRMKEAQ